MRSANPEKTLAVKAGSRSAHRVASLQNFWIRDARVGHVRVDARAAVPAGTCARAAANRLIVPQARVPKRQVVRAALHCSNVMHLGAILQIE